MRRYVDWLKTDDAAIRHPYTGRYVGSLVADFHRNLLYGGIFLYPASRRSSKGKLRVLYEAAPLAFVAEQAGGAASDGVRRIMDITPATLHERTPLFLGSIKDVRECEEFLQGRHPALATERNGPKGG